MINIYLTLLEFWIPSRSSVTTTRGAFVTASSTPPSQWCMTPSCSLTSDPRSSSDRFDMYLSSMKLGNPWVNWIICATMVISSRFIHLRTATATASRLREWEWTTNSTPSSLIAPPSHTWATEYAAGLIQSTIINIIGSNLHSALLCKSFLTTQEIDNNTGKYNTYRISNLNTDVGEAVFVAPSVLLCYVERQPVFIPVDYSSQRLCPLSHLPLLLAVFVSSGLSIVACTCSFIALLGPAAWNLGIIHSGLEGRI